MQRHRLFFLPALLFAFLLLTCPVWADAGGRIIGTATDQTGAVVPAATVTLINAVNGVKLTTATNGEGTYTFPAVPVASYILEVSLKGFQPYRRTGLVIDINSTLQVDFVLRVEDQNQTVEVTDEAGGAHVETADTTLGQVITSERVTEVPLNGRSYTDLLAIQAGVTPATTNAPAIQAGAGSFGAIAPSGDLNPGQFSMNGQRESANGFLLNGANVVEAIASAAAIVPNLDSIAEFRILTSNFDAQYGNYSGGLVNVVTKQGTNQIHGSLFEFLRNTDLDARGFFDPLRPQFNQNQFGGTIGGPIKKEKLFFFADYQGNRTVQGVETGLIPVPTLANRQGEFSAQDLSGVVNGPFLAQTLTQRLGYTVTQGEAFSQVFPNGVIPQSAWSTPAQQLLRYIPLPNTGSNAFSNASNTERIDDNKFSTRIDAFTRLGNLSAYYFYDTYDLNNPYPIQQGGASVPGFNALSPGLAQLVKISDTKTFGANMVNEILFSYMRNNNQMGQPVGGLGTSLASQGFASASDGGIIPLYPNLQGVETVVFNSFTLGTVPFTNNQVNQTFGVNESFSDVRGKHLLVAGGQAHFDYVLQNINLISNGEFQFFGSQTGVDFADFLLGLPSTYQQSYTPAFDNRDKYIGLFAQDSWRIKPDLTLNYGVRWEYMPAWSLAGDQTATFIPGDQSIKFPGAPLGYVFPGDQFPDGSTIPSSIAKTPLTDFSPRIGLAWSPGGGDSILGKLAGGPGKTSIRAGFGRFYTAIEGLTTAYQTGNPPYGLQYASPESPLFAQPFVGSLTGTLYPQPFPLVAPPSNVSRSNPDNNVNWSTFAPLSGAVGYYYKNPVPYALNYFFSLERQLGSNTVLTANYIGSESHHLITLLSANPGDPALCLSVSQTSQVAPGSATCGAFGENGVYTKADGTVINGTRTTLGPNFGSDSWFYNYGNAAYDSLQVSINHTTKRLSLLASYTFGKSIDNASNLQEQLYPFDHNLRRGISSFDIRHNFVASYRYELPFEEIIHHTPRLTEGWAVTGITRFSSGLPVTMVDFGDNSLIGSNNQGVNGMGVDLPNLAPGSLHINHNPANGKSYIDTSLFSIAPLGSPGNSPRRPFYGPGMENFDLALLKSTPLGGEKVMEFRWETFNTFNHPQFFGAGSVNGNINSSTFGQVISAMPPRIMQLAVKVKF
jgi:hypothetical protein